MTMDVALSEDLLIGADKIAEFLYGKSDRKSLSHVYRNVAGLSFFKHGNSIAAFKSTIRAELAEAQRKAREQFDLVKSTAPKPDAKPRPTISKRAQRRQRHAEQHA
jgi:hypothetical protein